MIRKGLAIFIFSALVLCLGGCETLKGACDGAKKDWASMQKVDDWMQKNMW